MVGPAGREREFWKLVAGLDFSGKIPLQGRSHLCRQRLRLIQRLWGQSRKGFLCRTCCSPPEVTDGVISLFNGAELIPLKQFCCCQEFIWLCWSHFHEEQGKAGLVSIVHWITVHCSRGWRYFNSQLSFQFPSLYQYNLEKKTNSQFVQDSVW